MDYEYLLFETIKVAENSSYARLTLNRPALKNALSIAVRDELIAALSRCAEDNDLKLVVLAGAGSCFCAGFDLKEALETDLESFDFRFRDFFEALYSFPKPLITVVHGAAFAGGFDTALSGDIIIATPNAQFGHPEIHFGVIPLLAPLSNKIPLNKAFELATLGSIIDAQEGLRIGLVNRIIASEHLAEKVHTIASTMALIPLSDLITLKKVKKSISRMDHSTATFIELQHFRRLAHNSSVQGKLETYFRSLANSRTGSI